MYVLVKISLVFRFNLQFKGKMKIKTCILRKMKL